MAHSRTKETLDETNWNAYRFNDSLYSLFDSQMREKGITFVRTTNVIHPEVICDATKLREIFLNILTIRKFADPEKAGITIVAMTANAFEEDRKNALRVGMNGHIAKPIRVEELLSLLASILKAGESD